MTAEQKWLGERKPSETQGHEDPIQQDTISPWSASLWLDPRTRAQEQQELIGHFSLNKIRQNPNAKRLSSIPQESSKFSLFVISSFAMTEVPPRMAP